MIQNTNYGASKSYVDAALSNTYTKAEVDTALATKANDNAVVHLAGAETIPGAKTFTSTMLATGQPAYSAALPATTVATIGTLNAYTPMVRTSGNQTVGGEKTFTNNITVNAQFPRYIFKMTDVDVSTPSVLQDDRGNIRWLDKNGVEAGAIRFSITGARRTIIQAKVRNSDGTYKYVTLAEGDTIA